MVELELSHLSRRFSSGGGVDDISLVIEQGELFVVLGPSGCGKSTLLRLIAGLEIAETGEIRFAAAALDGSASHRDLIAMVFQTHALYPHMTAFDNIAFPLRIKRVPKTDIAQRVAQAAALAALQIDLGRRPAQLSGGERQRVALARALVRQPRVILMDEPLSSLDAQLRGRLRLELKEFQRRTGRTMIYVTHDQLEALTLADRLAVMRAGRVAQVGAPDEIYRRPANLFVATFIGQPPMNILRSRLQNMPASAVAGRSETNPRPLHPHPLPQKSGRGDRGIEQNLIRVGPRVLQITPSGAESTGSLIGIRPEDLSWEPKPGASMLMAQFKRAEFVGAGFLVYASIEGQDVVIASPKAAPTTQVAPVYVEESAVHLFDPVTECRIADSGSV